jgi:hypothetical protein
MRRHWSVPIPVFKINAILKSFCEGSKTLLLSEKNIEKIKIALRNITKNILFNFTGK